MTRAILVCLVSLGLAACTETETIETRLNDPDFGVAVRHNMAQHIVNPVPPNPAVAAPADGQRRLVAIERYRADEVEAPATTAISDVGPTGE